MQLFHGSNMEVREPKLLERQRELDFGKGFYTTTDFEQAAKWARRTTRIRSNGSPLVSVFDFDESLMESLSVLRFDKPDGDWLDFVAANRKGVALDSDWDVIWGPVANDQAMPTLLFYLDGYLPAQAAIAKLLPQRLKDQVTFKSIAAIECLRFAEVRAA